MAGAKFTWAVKRTDRGWRRILEFARAGGKHVLVGIIDDARRRRGGGPTNAMLLAVHEYGTATVPERAPMRTWFARYRGRYLELTRKLLRGILRGKLDEDQALGLLGAQAAADLKATIRSGLPPPDAPATVRRKGSSKTLVDTGQMVDAVTWQVSK